MKSTRVQTIIRLSGNLSCIAMALLISMLFIQCSSNKVNDSAQGRRVLMDAGWKFKLVPEATLANAVEIVNWRCKADNKQGTETVNAGRDVDTSGAEWKDSKSGDDNMGCWPPCFMWFRTTLPAMQGPNRTIHFETVDDNCTIYLNGKQIAQHEGWNDPFDVSVDEAWDEKGSNTLALLVGNSPSLHGGITAAVTLGQKVPVEMETQPFEAGFSDNDWKTIHLPHDYVSEGTFTQSAPGAHGFLPMPAAWYRKTFILPSSAADKSVWIDFDGVYRNSIVYLNGKKLGQHTSGYTSFRYDINEAANFGGENVLAVYTDPRRFEGWFYEGGGIYRHVWLNMASKLHVAPWGTFVSTDLPEPGADGTVSAAKINIKTKIINSGTTPAKCELVSRLIDKAGNTVDEIKSETTVLVGEAQELDQVGSVKNPSLWKLDTPNLYKLCTYVKMDGKTIDSTFTPFGIRTIRFDVDKGFFLNGQPVKIQGMCCHNDFAVIGAALTDSLEYWRVKQLKSMGCNAWRVGHCPPSPALLNACDELGMLVMDENRHLGDTYMDHTEPGHIYSNPQDLADMVQRDRNHPSIILWSMCNEEWLQGSEEGVQMMSGMMKTVHQYDTTRLVTSAMNGKWFMPGFRTVEDIMGVNYSPEIYDQFHKEFPKMPMFGSETSSTKMTRGKYEDDKEKSIVSSYSVVRDCWKSIGERPFMAGSFSWTGFDYKGEARWPAILNQSGALDLCGFPKDSYYYFQSWWTITPMIHILPHWNWAGKEGQEIYVVVLSNCARVELFSNGASLGVKDMPRNGHLEWMVKYAPGNISAKGFNGTEVAADETIETTGAPASLRLKSDRKILLTDGEDIARVEVEVLDAQGRVVPTADNQVDFKVEGVGTVVGAGNGDASDHTPDKAPFRKAFSGKCMVFVGAAEKSGNVVLTATSNGLKDATISFQAKEN
ncbi:MAG TPA: glycoside hydrolase family 2 TIM barrel-domain containing protein [Prolixibacteraceae bacterium]|nr:glycoside hydrolase family 2 TIM barrel-domain containing protein [Prolixibacteraceae bacterium]